MCAQVRSQLLDITTEGSEEARRRLLEGSGTADLDSVRRSVCSAYFFNAASFKGLEENKEKGIEQEQTDDLTLKAKRENVKAHKTLSHKLELQGMESGVLYSRTAYTSLLSDAEIHMHPDSVLFGLGVPTELVIYHQLILTTKPYMHCLTAVDPAWLVEAGPMFYSIQKPQDSDEEEDGSQKDPLGGLVYNFNDS